MPLETTVWDAADHLDTDEAIAAYLNAVFEDGDPELIAAAIGDVARAKRVGGMQPNADGEGPSSPRRDGSPAFSTILQLIKRLGLHLEVRPN